MEAEPSAPACTPEKWCRLPGATPGDSIIAFWRITPTDLWGASKDGLIVHRNGDKVAFERIALGDIRDVWADGTEAEITFIYSACGCPVKVLCRRTGDRTVRVKEMPVIFPDDPAVVEVITRLMRW